LTEILRIGVDRILVRNERIKIEPVHTYIINAPSINTPNVPVVLNVGMPVIDIPGCVESRKSSKENDNLVSNDPDGNVFICDAQYPSYNAMEFTPSELIYTEQEQTQRYEEPETLPAPEVPQAKPTDCPPDGAPEVGTKVEEGTKQIIKYELVGNRCVTRYKKLNVQQQIIDAIPTVPQVVKTGGITLVATTAALSTPLLLKAVKPIIKQIINRVKKILGKKAERPNLSERRTISYREKRGLPPLKKKK
jgi:hypothetical protein